jgi:A/G-specific adenine glycosylase
MTVNAEKVTFINFDIQAFRHALLTWGEQNYRNFPWRRTTDPYLILMAEVMLHRTKALQVVPVYERFADNYPSFTSLLSVSEQELGQMLYSLGLHWRVALIYKMITEIQSRFNGQIPQVKNDLLSLAGVSDYVASAVRCFAWNLPEALVDTNTVRITGRLFGLKVTDYSRRNRKFRDLITALVDLNNPKMFNYALLDLADRICTKIQSPKCHLCPVNKFCMYGIQILGNTNLKR